MLIKKHINVCDEKLLSGLSYVLDIVGDIEHSDCQEVVIDFEHAKFVSPLFVLPLLVYVGGSDKKISYSNITPYLRCVKFGDEVRPDVMSES